MFELRAVAVVCTRPKRPLLAGSTGGGHQPDSAQRVLARVVERARVPWTAPAATRGGCIGFGPRSRKPAKLWTISATKTVRTSRGRGGRPGVEFRTALVRAPPPLKNADAALRRARASRVAKWQRERSPVTHVRSAAWARSARPRRPCNVGPLGSIAPAKLAS
jgi:hypothetical protein